MAKRVVIDELHLAFRIPSEMHDSQAREIRRELNSNKFMIGLRKAVRSVLKSHPHLAVISVSVSR